MTARILDEARLLARPYEPDRYVAALLSPRSVRFDLLALATFAADLGRISTSLTEPMMARIRLQWWREVVGDETPAERSGHPVADQLRSLAQRRPGLRELLLAAIDVTEEELDDASLDSFERSVEKSTRRERLLFAASASLLGLDPEERASLPHEAGAAFGAASLARRLHSGVIAEGRYPALALEGLGNKAAGSLAYVQKELRSAPKTWRVVLAPLAMVRPYLALVHSMSRQDRLAGPDILHLRRVWRLWRAARSGKFA